MIHAVDMLYSAWNVQTIVLRYC